MDEFEKLYTVDDIARMTMLTSRTIRNYLKDGVLTGRKIGGQWRFTAKDIESLFNNSSVEEEIKNNRRQEIMDFINGINTDIDGEIQLCTIADYYCPDMQTTKELSLKFSDMISAQNTNANLRFQYEYIDKEQKARYTFFGTPTYIKAAATVLDEEWHRLNISQFKFSDKAVDYEKFRPSYPDKSIDFIHSLMKKEGNIIADVGSGTGKMTELLLKRKNIVYAIEPNEEMRKIAESKFYNNKSFHSINQTADHTGLNADSMDSIICGESYHWFDDSKTVSEFKRILKPEGFVFLLWNAPGNNSYNSEIDDLFCRYCNQNSSEIISVSKEDRAIHLFGEGNYNMVEFENIIYEPYEGLLGGSLSSAFAPKPGDENYAVYVKGIKDIFDKYSKDGIIEAKFMTRCYYGHL